MTKLYESYPLSFALALIGAYVVGMSLCDSVSAALGIEKLLSAGYALLFSAWLLHWLRKNKLSRKYGLCAPSQPARQLLYYFPLVLLCSTNLWHGVHSNLSPLEILLYILSMIGVGILEELLFRGFLFWAIWEDNPRQAVLISSVTFGIGHIVNLLNGAPLLATSLQICYAVAAGYLFTVLFLKTGSLLPCIITHCVINSLSVFSQESRSEISQLISAAFLCVVSLGYALYLNRKTQK